MVDFRITDPAAETSVLDNLPNLVEDGNAIITYNGQNLPATKLELSDVTDPVVVTNTPLLTSRPPVKSASQSGLKQVDIIVIAVISALAAVVLLIVAVCMHREYKKRATVTIHPHDSVHEL